MGAGGPWFGLLTYHSFGGVLPPARNGAQPSWRPGSSLLLQRTGRGLPALRARLVLCSEASWSTPGSGPKPRQAHGL